ncbi:GIY-YIG nuclease family protein [Flavobacterium sp.]|uniref:GIY-YIG nuclease family protein n=1 Tax=Flavobacterium sp. TaxID=239 RepID=UPI0038FCDBB0
MEIYLITNLILKKGYIGQTIWDFQSRYNGSWWTTTHNNLLKKDVIKYGVENFAITILHKNIDCRDELSALEEFYIKQYQTLSPKGYNKLPGGKRKYINEWLSKEYDLVDSFGNEFRINNLSQFCHNNNLNYSAMLNMVSGINTSSNGFALKGTDIKLIINPNEQWEVENIKDGKIYLIKRGEIDNFCSSHHLRKRLLLSVLRGQVDVSMDFKLKNTILSKQQKNNGLIYKDIELENPNGEIVIINSIYKYCKENPPLDRKGFYDLINGKTAEYRGWKLPLEKRIEKKRKIENLGKRIQVLDIKNEKILEIKNISEFCRNNKLDLNNFYTMIRGDIKQYMDYTVPGRDLSGYNKPKRIIFLSLVHTSGEVISSKNPKTIQFVSSVNPMISSESVYSIINGEIQSAKGWTLLDIKYKY